MTLKHVAPLYHPPAADTLETLHIDDHIIVIDKPSGLLSVPGRGPEKAICAVSIVTARHGEVFTVHRLDMDTSGIIVFARTKDAQKALSRQFERRETSKTYIAVVEGLMPSDSGRISLPIAKFSLNRPLRHTAPDGQEAITNWRVIACTHTTTRLDLTPETGRSHQLRLHLKEIGHPILGDAFYGNENNAPRLLLHAQSLGFTHPATGQPVSFNSPAPF